MRFEIVNHNHNYPRLLAWQLSSLIKHPPRGHQIDYTLCCHGEDGPVFDVVDFFAPKMPYNVKITVQTQMLDILRNRAVGRNEAALATKADWVWFTDTDYMFLNRCWENLYEQLLAASHIRFATPLDILETDWPKGDAMIAEMSELAVRDVDLTGVPMVHKHVAIGGIQIAHGPTVREIGYCGWLTGPREKWDFKSDMKFRRQREMQPQMELQLDSVLRIRHSQRGYGQENWEEVRN